MPSLAPRSPFSSGPSAQVKANNNASLRLVSAEYGENDQRSDSAQNRRGTTIYGIGSLPANTIKIVSDTEVRPSESDKKILQFPSQPGSDFAAIFGETPGQVLDFTRKGIISAAKELPIVAEAALEPFKMVVVGPQPEADQSETTQPNQDKIVSLQEYKERRQWSEQVALEEAVAATARVEMDQVRLIGEVLTPKHVEETGHNNTSYDLIRNRPGIRAPIDISARRAAQLDQKRIEAQAISSNQPKAKKAVTTAGQLDKKEGNDTVATGIATAA